MVGLRNIVAGIIAALLITATAYADMMPAFELVPGRQQRPRVCASGGPAHTDPAGPFADTSIVDPFSLFATSLPVAHVEARPVSALPPLRIRSDGQSSLSLCLYALIGLGLCRSVPWARRLSLAGVPEWFHDGGPIQIGHSFAVSPDCRCPAPACFIQPGHAVEDPIRQCRWDTPLCWRSQVTPTTLAPRGPPL